MILMIWLCVIAGLGVVSTLASFLVVSAPCKLSWETTLVLGFNFLGPFQGFQNHFPGDLVGEVEVGLVG